MSPASFANSHSTPSLSTSSFLPHYRPFATLGRAGRPSAAKSPVTQAAAAATEKKPASAYALYVKETFPKAKAQAGADAAFSQVSKTVSSQWKTLDPAEKSKYQSAYLSAKAAWDQKYPQGAPAAPKKTRGAAAAAATPDAAAAPAAPARKARTPKAQRKPPSGYAAYVKEQFQKFKKDGESAPQTMKVLAGHWKSLSDAEKAKYKVTA